MTLDPFFNPHLIAVHPSHNWVGGWQYVGVWIYDKWVCVCIYYTALGIALHSKQFLGEIQTLPLLTYPSENTACLAIRLIQWLPYFKFLRQNICTVQDL